MDERVRFIAANAEDPRDNCTQLCARFGISRTQGYKWVQRYREQGPEGLRDRKSVAECCPHRTAAEVESRVVEFRKRYPYYGPKKLRPLQQMHPELVWPATIGDILERNGLIRPRRMRLRVAASSSPLGHAHRPNDVWCTDFKGDFGLGDGTRCCLRPWGSMATGYPGRVPDRPGRASWVLVSVAGCLGCVTPPPGLRAK